MCNNYNKSFKLKYLNVFHKKSNDENLIFSFSRVRI